MTRPRKRKRSASGFTLIELIIVLAVLLTALSIFSQTMVAASKQQLINRENAVAAEAVRTLLESMRNEPFEDLWFGYNERTDDDPDGPGTGPGNRFPVDGLEPLDEAADGMVGQILMPSLLPAPVPGTGPGPSPGFNPGAGPAPVLVELREDLEDEVLGMPRDLNGNSIIEDTDRCGDYILLPVRIRLDWKGPFGSRRMEVLTMFAEFRS